MFFKKKALAPDSGAASKADSPATSFLIGGLPENLRRLILRATVNGVVSKAEVDYAGEVDGLSPEEVYDALALISDIGVSIKEEYDEGEELAPEPPGEEPEEEDSIYGVARNKVEKSAAMREFLESHQEEEVVLVDPGSSDPVRNYLRAMGGIELFSRAGEIAIAKRIEAGRKLLIEGLCKSPMTLRKIIGWHAALQKEEVMLREIVNLDL
ncbi:MAG: hypothetical protein LBH41_01770, partial [Rickettsiales bacterium]|nr:hypothetical protein [Rickettsiales bacterium]